MRYSAWGFPFLVFVFWGLCGCLFIPLKGCFQRGGAVLAVAGHQLFEPVDEGGWKVWAEGGQRSEAVVAVGDDDLGAGVALEGNLLGEGVVEDAAKGVDVGTEVDGGGFELFRGHEVDGAEKTFGAGLVLALVRRRLVDFGEAEIEDFDLERGAAAASAAWLGLRLEHDILRLEVEVDDVLGVRGGHACEGLADEGIKISRVHPASADGGLEGFTLKEFHDDVAAFLVHSSVVDGDDVWVAEGGQEAGFPHHAVDRGTEAASVLHADAFEGHLPGLLVVPGLEDGAEAALGDEFADLVTVVDHVGIELTIFLFLDQSNSKSQTNHL